eukprot:7385104-Prymnesium_polylepis.1
MPHTGHAKNCCFLSAKARCECKLLPFPIPGSSTCLHVARVVPFECVCWYMLCLLNLHPGWRGHRTADVVGVWAIPRLEGAQPRGFLRGVALDALFRVEEAFVLPVRAVVA